MGAARGTETPAARYEQREALELAFVVAREMLPARQRAALILSEGLGFSAREAAEALDTTTTSVYSALQRARKVIDDRRPEHSEQTALRALDDDELRAAGERFARAMERADVETILAMVREESAQRPSSAARSDSTRACDTSSEARSSRSLVAA
jgi:RNA polymerase sigma-70 factor (ECF subfamily)